jgi:hypothetical protein
MSSLSNLYIAPNGRANEELGRVWKEGVVT